jgi:flagellar biosynthetic protein FlhB
MADQGFQEKTEQATPRRREKAREEGKVAKSPEVNSAAMLSFGFLSLFMLGPGIGRKLQDLMAYVMSNAPELATSDPTFLSHFSDVVFRFFGIVAPIFAAMTVVALSGNIAQIGFKICPKSLKPKWEKLDVLKGLKRLFSITSLVNLVKDTVKLTIVGVVAYKAIAGEFDTFFMLPSMSVTDLAIAMGRLAAILGLKVGAIMIVIAILDYLYKKYEFDKSIKMSKQEIKEENKDTEGNPQMKSHIRQMQRQRSQQRMMAAVPTADVVVTNPTHLAVALKYDGGQMDAPFVVAKGERLIAQKIKELARANDIPIVEDKPLARSLFKMCDIGDAVPANLYRAVAELLAYVYRLKRKVVGNRG